MPNPLQRLGRRRPLLTAASVLALAVLTSVACSQVAGWAHWKVFAHRIDEASCARPESRYAPSYAEWSFAFRDAAVLLRVPVDPGELARARGVDTASMFRAQGPLRALYVKRVVSAQADSRFIEGFARSLRSVRNQRGLDSDEYLELIARAIQSLPYGTSGDRVRLPVEVVASGMGVCSEKALLLGAVMLHEGYRTAMWVHDSQNHVALGVASDGATFRGTGYAYIETTRVSYVGQIDPEYRGAGPIQRPPQFIELGGSKRYASGYQVEFILRELAHAQRTTQSLEPYVSGLSSASGRFQALYQQLSQEQFVAGRLADYIRGQTDDRERVFERLVASLAESAEGRPSYVR